MGAWCFADHLGPAELDERRGVQIGPHPRIGLQTVTWLLQGTQVHHDSFGTEQLIRPGQLNLMTGGRRPALGGAEATRHGPADFEDHVELPQVELADATATVLARPTPEHGSAAARRLAGAEEATAVVDGDEVVLTAPSGGAPALGTRTASCCCSWG